MSRDGLSPIKQKNDTYISLLNFNVRRALLIESINYNFNPFKLTRLCFVTNM